MPQTARTTILTTPDFKAYLVKEAKKEGISVSELVRQRCEGETEKKEEERLLNLVSSRVKEAIKKTQKTNKLVDKVLKEIKERSL